MKAVLASRNRHKAEQIARLLPGLTLLSLEDVDPELRLEEPFETFEDNALAKARAVVGATGMPAIADDSGIEVDALGGAPGVRSARFAGDGATDAANNAKLVAALRDVPEEERTCRYRCAAVFVDTDGREIVAHGSCEGRVVLEGRGDLGFGYDPHVIPEGETRTMGEIPLEEKLAFSHRGRAFRELARMLADASGGLGRRHEQDAPDELAEVNESIAHLGRPHEAPPLDVADLDPDPIVEFGRWMQGALVAGLLLPNTMTLSTATAAGRPSARMVLLKGFDHAGFVFYTSYESRKSRELAENPAAALVFHWPELERQVRVEGRVTKVTAEESDSYFRSRPLGSRLGAWASRQSEPLSSRLELERRLEEAAREHGDADVPRPPYWGGWRVTPDAIELWQGRPNRLHDRFLYSRAGAGEWSVVRLSP